MGSRALAGFVCVVLLAAGCGDSAKPPPPSQARLTPQIARELDGRLRKQLDISGVPGISAAIVFPDRRVWSGAVGDAVLEPQLPMTPRTTLPFDSVTKIAIATLALRLTEQGKLRLDDPVRRWYPAWQGDPRATVRDLLGHTSGTRDPGEALFVRAVRHPSRVVTTRQLLAASPKPGPRSAGVRYSNTGFVIAGMILERAAGEPLARADAPRGLRPSRRRRPRDAAGRAAARRRARTSTGTRTGARRRRTHADGGAARCRTARGRAWRLVGRRAGG